MMIIPSASHNDRQRINVTPRMALLFNALALGSVTLASLLPLMAVVHWLSIDADEVRSATGLASGLLPNISMGQRIAAAGLALVASLPLAWALARLKSCLNSFAAGRPFAPAGIAGLRDFAFGSMLAALAQLFSHTAVALVLTWNAAPGHRQLVVQINSELLLLALFAGVIAALTWALERAAEVLDENNQFV
ncbi:hypothetical protein [Devosia sp. CAU 1758]